MEIERLIWLRRNVAKLAEHGIGERDIDDLIGTDSYTVTVHPDYPDQVRVIGQTRNGRFLTLVLEATDTLGVWRPVTGWETTATEEAYWQENK